MNNNYARIPGKVSLTQIFLICLLVTAIPVNAGAQEPQANELSSEQRVQKAKDHYSIGKQLIQQGNYLAADKEFKKAQQLLSAGPVAAVDTTQYPAQLPQAVSGSAQPLSLSRPPASMAWEAGIKGKSEEAIMYYLQAIALAPTDASLHYNLAVEYLRTNKFESASESLKKVIQLNARDKDAYYNLGVLYDSYLNDKEQALRFYSQYIKLAGKTEDVNQVRAWIRQIQKEMKGK